MWLLTSFLHLRQFKVCLLRHNATPLHALSISSWLCYGYATKTILDCVPTPSLEAKANRKDPRDAHTVRRSRRTTLAPRYPQPFVFSVPSRVQNFDWRLRLTFVEQGEQPTLHTFVSLSTYATNSDNMQNTNANTFMCSTSQVESHMRNAAPYNPRRLQPCVNHHSLCPAAHH